MDTKEFLKGLLNDMDNKARKAKGHNPQTDEDIMMYVSLSFAMGYIKTYAKIKGVEL